MNRSYGTNLPELEARFMFNISELSFIWCSLISDGIYALG